MICANCGQHLHDRAVFCDNCGQRLRSPRGVRPASFRAPKVVGKRDALVNLVLSALALGVLVCLYLKWLLVLGRGEADRSSYTLLQLASSIDASGVGRAWGIARLLAAALLLNTVFWALFIWRTLRYLSLQRVFSQLAGVMTVALVMVTSFAVTMLNSGNIGSSWGSMSASMSMAPFCAAAFSIFLMMSVSIRRSKGRRVGRPAGATDADGAFYGEGLPEPDSVASSLVDLGVLLNSGRLGPALVRTEPDSESVGQRLEAFERRDEQQEIADEG